MQSILVKNNDCRRENWRIWVDTKTDQTVWLWSWFDKKYDEEHKNTLRILLEKIINSKIAIENWQKLRLWLKERYVGDPNQEIISNLRYGKLRSKEELQIEIKRQMQIFLELIIKEATIRNKN